MATPWTEELKATVIAQYVAAEPTADTSIEILKEIAEEHEVSPNGVRMILVKAKVYVAKTPAASSATASGGTKRVSKGDILQELTDLIKEKGKEVDEEIINKMTGKMGTYIIELLKG